MQDIMSAEVREHNGKPTLFINGEPGLAMQYALTDCPGGRFSWEEVPAWNIRQFASCGFTQFQLDVWLDQLWTLDENGEEQFDITLVRRQIAGVVEQCPQAAVFLRLHVNAPRWWNTRNPDEVIRYLNAPLEEEDTFGVLRRPLINDLKPVPRASFASDKWKKDSGARVAQLLRELAQTPEAAHLAGVQPACGVFGEWHQFAFFCYVGDASPAMRRHFSRWLREKYGTEEALSAAFGAPTHFDDDLIPTEAERRHTGDGIFRDLRTERKVIDYYTCQHENLADTVLYFCRICKENWPKPLVTGSFFGYFFSVFGLHAAGGHIASYPRALSSPYIDYFSAPQGYSDIFREQGGSGQSRGLIDSMRLYGKLWLDEMDQLPSFDQLRMEDPPRTKNVREDIWLYRRNVGYAYTHGVGQWFYDFGPTDSAGWWDHPDMLADIKRMRELFAAYSERPYESNAQVLMLYDSEVFYHLGPDSGVDPLSDKYLLDEMSGLAFRSGAAVETVHFSCMERVDFDRYRCVIFANCFRMTAQQRQVVREKVLCGGRHVVFCCAPGYTDSAENRLAFVEEVTGFALKKITSPQQPFAEVRTAAGLRRYGMHQGFAPFFVPDLERDAAICCAGTLCGGTEAALAYKQEEDCTVWYSSLAVTDAVVLREIFRKAGAHVYVDSGDIVYAGGGILLLHTASGGHKTVALRSGRAVQLEISPNATVFLDEETGGVILPEECGECREGYFTPYTECKCRPRQKYAGLTAFLTQQS